MEEEAADDELPAKDKLKASGAPAEEEGEDEGVAAGGDDEED